MFGRVVSAAAMALLLVSCAKDPGSPQSVEKPADTTAVALHFNAAPGLNPGVTGEPAPVRVRIYELKNSAAFLRADYFALAERAQATLGADLVDQDEVQVLPGQQLDIERDLNPATRQVGLVVGYREIDQARWRSVLSVSSGQSTPFRIDLDARAVNVPSSTRPAQ
jgi:type VI secretion system protein VasD